MKSIKVLLLAAVAAAAASGCATQPVRRGDAASLIGKNAPDWGRLEWIEGAPKMRLKDLRGKVVVLHWWTDGCPDCVTNVRTINALAERYERRPVQVIGMYFPVPPGSVRSENMREVTSILGIRFPVAFDAKWKALKAYWLDYSDRTVLTPTVVIDSNGVIRAIMASQTIGEEDAKRLDTLVMQLSAETPKAAY